MKDKVDIKENEILKLSSEILNCLFKDHTDVKYKLKKAYKEFYHNGYQINDKDSNDIKA